MLLRAFRYGPQTALVLRRRHLAKDHESRFVDPEFFGQRFGTRQHVVPLPLDLYDVAVEILPTHADGLWTQKSGLLYTLVNILETGHERSIEDAQLICTGRFLLQFFCDGPITRQGAAVGHPDPISGVWVAKFDPEFVGCSVGDHELALRGRFGPAHAGLRNGRAFEVITRQAAIRLLDLAEDLHGVIAEPGSSSQQNQQQQI